MTHIYVIELAYHMFILWQIAYLTLIIISNNAALPLIRPYQTITDRNWIKSQIFSSAPSLETATIFIRIKNIQQILQFFI